MRHIYLAATGMNRGKTTTSLGLLDGFIARGLSVGFTKPVGQRTVTVQGVPADEDAVLMQTVFSMPDDLSVMSPVHIPRGFTKAYISGEVVEDLGARLVSAHRTLADRDVVLVEGTGHAGVGAVVGLSNAVVASMLDAPAVIVSEGGVGRPIDEIVLNAALFARHGVEVAGAIVNKVDTVSQPGIAGYLERGLALHGIPLLGVLPLRPILSNPTLAMVQEGLRGELLWPGPDLDQVIERVVVAAMGTDHVRERLGPGMLVIVSADRDDVLETISAAHVANGEQAAAGLVLTGRLEPGPAAMAAIRRADLFATYVAEDTYAAASDVHDLLVKTHPGDAGKIALIKALVDEHLDIERILGVARAPASIAR